MASLTRRKSRELQLQQKIAELKKEIRVLRRDKKRLEQEMTAEREGK